MLQFRRDKFLLLVVIVVILASIPFFRLRSTNEKYEVSQPSLISALPISRDKLNNSVGIEAISAIAQIKGADETQTQIANNKIQSRKVARLNSRGFPLRIDTSWESFLSMSNNSQTPAFNVGTNFQPIQFCPKATERNLSIPRLSKDQIKWCKWAINPKGGRVVVGKSWGELVKREDRNMFDELNCNINAKGKNPTCNDAWGDSMITTWRSNIARDISCDGISSSSIQCADKLANGRICSLKNAMIDFSKYSEHKLVYPRVGSTRKFNKGFFSFDCPNLNTDETFVKFKHLFDTKLSSQRCDYVINGTVLVYSHEMINNLAHTMNDIFNVWASLWLVGLAREMRKIRLLNIDGFHQSNTFSDKIDVPFFNAYKRSFDMVLKGMDFGNQTVCFKELIVQPFPTIPFVWDSWVHDNECSFRGPSTLFQRFNLALRRSFGLTKDVERFSTSNKLKVLMLVRKQYENNWDNEKTERNTLNQKAVDQHLRNEIARYFPAAEYVSLVFESISYMKQLKLIANASIVIGMHGAGIAHTVHMSLGTKYCCGVIEIFPHGAHSHIRGFGNMVRRLGMRYDRLDIADDQSTSVGATIPPVLLASKTIEMLRDIDTKPSCVLRSVFDDPFLDKGAESMVTKCKQNEQSFELKELLSASGILPILPEVSDEAIGYIRTTRRTCIYPLYRERIMARIRAAVVSERNAAESMAIDCSNARDALTQLNDVGFFG